MYYNMQEIGRWIRNDYREHNLDADLTSPFPPV